MTFVGGIVVAVAVLALSDPQPSPAPPSAAERVPARGAAAPLEPAPPFVVPPMGAAPPLERATGAAPAAAFEEPPGAVPAPDPEPEKKARDDAPPSIWPPARAFTERCKAAGGDCAPGCTALAGNRCLDPCFIHTAECSQDCLQPDGSCGFPPPDAE